MYEFFKHPWILVELHAGTTFNPHMKSVALFLRADDEGGGINTCQNKYYLLTVAEVRLV